MPTNPPDAVSAKERIKRVTQPIDKDTLEWLGKQKREPYWKLAQRACESAEQYSDLIETITDELILIETKSRRAAAEKMRERYEELRASTQALFDLADKEGLLVGGGRNHPNEKEGPVARRIREALRNLKID
jgi:hypothetical protein